MTNLVLNAWCNQNNQQSQTPGLPVNVVNFSVTPDTAGGQPGVTGGKIVGNLTIQNVTDDIAAFFKGGPAVTITIAITPPPSS